MTENIRKCNILQKMTRAEIESGHQKIRSYFSNGLNAPYLVHPENLVAWVSSDDSGLKNEYVHRRLVLKLILCGKVRTMLDGRPFTMNPGDAVLFFPYQIHATQKNGDPALPYRFAAVTFTLDSGDLERLHPLRNRVFRLSENEEDALVKIVAAYQKEKNAAEAVWLLAGILQNRAAEAEKLPDTRRETESDDEFLRICEYIRTHLKEPLSMKTLADAFHVSRETVRRHFKRHFNTLTPSGMLRALRLQLAAEQLAHADIPIAEIAEECGYSTQFIFSSAFRNAYGVSPSEYRKEHRR